ncbi:MAG: mltE [Pedosphaera sp.]|nr:mltE [Pedosphaera sp.]
MTKAQPDTRRAGNFLGLVHWALVIPFTIGYKHRVKRLLFLMLLLLLTGAGGYWGWHEWRDHSQDTPILAAARFYGVEPALVKAVVWRESRFNADRRGRAGEIGLMQIREGAAGEWAHAERVSGFKPANLFHPGTNTLAGSWYLHRLLKRYSRTDNPLPYALADYNAGRSNVLKWQQGSAKTNSLAFINQIGFPGTKNYVKSVMRRAEHYRPIFPPKE